MQHDFNLENQQGASFRADLNAALQALVTCSSGSAAPTSPYPFQLWMDTAGASPVLKRRNADNTAWKVEDPGAAGTYFKRDDDGNVMGLTPPQVAEELSPHLGNFEPGTRMVFHQPTAPTGWTQDASVNDRVLRVVSGMGGGIGGNWTITGLSASVSVHNTTLSTSNIPAHGHPLLNTSDRGTFAQWNSNGGRVVDAVSYGNPTNRNGVVLSTGGGGAHAHGASASVSQNGTWRPSYTDVIVCKKD